MTDEQKTDKDSSKKDNSSDAEIRSNTKFEEDLSSQSIENLTTYIAQKQEDTRSQLAKTLLWLLIGTYIGSFLILIGVIFYPMQTNVDKSTVYTYIKDVVTLLITTQTALVGTALGFYFGSRNNQ